MSSPVAESEIVVFNARFCGNKKAKSTKTDDKPVLPKFNTYEPEQKTFNIKRARYEVIRYGMTGFDKEQQMNSKIAMAIRLGAKPPKKKYINYKELIEQKKKEKESSKNEKKNQYNLQPLKQSKKKSTKKKNRKKNPVV